MAEGDSIARLAARLHRWTAGARIAASEFRHPRWATADLAGRTITGWHPRGKHLLLRTDDGWTLHSHLRMSGSWSVLRPGSRYPRGLRVALLLADGRTLAGVALPVVTLVRTRDEGRVVGHLGPDLLAAGFDAGAAAARLRADPGTPAVVALLDQRRVAGLGNLWAQELLFLHRTSPWAPIGEVDLPPLLDHARRLLQEAVATNHGQVTTGDPRPGRRHWVYGRKGRPCLRCGAPVAFAAPERTPHGRETWWCPVCQARNVAHATTVGPGVPPPPEQERPMPQPEGAQLDAVRARREALKEKYLRPLDERPASLVRGVHHVALIARDVEETIRFYQDLLGFPLVELVENRDYRGSSHFFFDIGHRNLLGFFDFPGHDHPDFTETIGAVQHLALSVTPEAFAEAKRRLDDAGIAYTGPDRGIDNSLYIRDPNGVGIEFYSEELGVFEGEPLVRD